MVKVLFICHGNICRSPMAESVMTHLVREAGLEKKFLIRSAATSREEIGNPVHYGTRRKLQAENVPLVPHNAVQMTKKDYATYDLIVAMDRHNLRNMEWLVGSDPRKKVHLLLDFTQRKGDIADPWYTGDFDETYRDVLEGCEGLLKYCKEHLL